MPNENAPDPTKMYLNGIDGTTGEPLVSPLSIAAVGARLAATERPVPQVLADKARALQNEAFALPVGIFPEDPSSAGWGIIFATNEDPAVRAALQPLIDHRTTKHGAGMVKILEYRPGETWAQWMLRNGAVSGQVSPAVVPYYLALVGSPEKIPYDFQYLLDIDYALGRIAFDQPGDYAAYARSVVSYETAAALENRKALVLWGTRNRFDRATALSADSLVAPLAQGYQPGVGAAQPAIGQADGFASQSFLAATATKASLRDVLHDPGAGRPSLLFTASHGLGWPKDDPRLLSAQGALLCQDWPGQGAPQAAHYFAAEDVANDACLSGLICFHFACYSAGTPQLDDFSDALGQPPGDLAASPFVAALPKRLLSHPGGGALAVIGHVARAWGCSIPVNQIGPRIMPFENALRRIMLGQPVGQAVKDFNELFASRSAELTELQQRQAANASVNDMEIALTWTERNDARNYVVLGDPAVALRPDLLKTL